MKHKLSKAFVYVVIAVMIVSTATFLYWSFEPRTVITVEQPAPVRPDIINPEATVIVSPHVCKYLNKEAKVERFLISNSAKIALPVYPNRLPLGCKTYDLPVIIPAYVPDGIYHLEYNVTYVINPLVTSPVTWVSKSFEVKHEPPLALGTPVATPVTSSTSSTVITNQTDQPEQTNVTVTAKQNKSIIDNISGLVNNVLGKVGL